MRPVFEQMHFIEQFAESVVDYTSRYNNSSSVSYAPENIIGRPTNYPMHGDFPDTYSLRSYGTWWSESEGAQKDYMPQDRDPIVSEDYIEVKFEQPVIATKVLIYETFNPGAVVRIWGGRRNSYWSLLWQGPPRKYPQDHKSVTFAPKLNLIQDLVELIRIEFNQSLSDYHISIDAVLLAGYRPRTPLQTELINNRLVEVKPPISKKKHKQVNIEEEPSDDSIFLLLPHEVIVYILSFLDLRSLCNCSLVNRTFRMASNDSLLYRDLSFKRYWNRVTDHTLQQFETKCKFLRKLDLSWCGCENKITSEGFIRFLKHCGTHLTHLSLNKCYFVQADTLRHIVKCRELIDLRLRHCSPSPRDSFLLLADLNCLRSLDLYSSKIDDQSLVKIIQNNRGLKHLIIDLCENLRELDFITESIAAYNKQLRTFSCWKTQSLTSEGIKSLSKCSDLRELDLGWCLMLGDPGDCLAHIAQNCPHLTRLIVAGWRGLGDHQLLPIVRYCNKIQQLDLLGTRGITSDICERALRIFHDLKLLDVSYCDGVTLRQVESWRREYPNVSIKKSCVFASREYQLLQPH